ncbi:unnamed protein product [Mycena citricolor]|uniref:sterol 22-desaturase n=1 Tax=Mycena citricolor TaxID=2018698 RepID=A0AAD2GW03_9AGAR|nr:unnamed protein product [Mycena citricolor]CAK5279904.1 unnamed protein product [Mycena citricolor]
MSSILKASSAAIPSFTSNPLHALASSSPSSSIKWLYTTGAILFALLALEQGIYRAKKRHLPGAKWTIPLIGKFADSLKPTVENYKKQWDSGDLSAVSVFNIFIVMASSNDYARKILHSPTYAEPCLVNSAKSVLLPENWVFLTGKEHVDYRRGLNNLFTRKALGLYVGIQDVITRKHLKEWRQDFGKSAQPLMMPARWLNMDTSLRVFCGSYIPDDAAKEISDKYWFITQALELVNFPLALPGTKIYKAIQARKVALGWLEFASKRSKEEMAGGGEPTCMLDSWNQLLNDPGYKGRRDFSDHEMGMVLMSFLFASQDAMSSGLIYAFQHLVDRPDILTKVREEQVRVRKGDYDQQLTLELMDEMTYLQAFVKESLRVKPPVVMVPYKSTKAFPISDDYTVPSGSMLIPSFYNSLHDATVYPEPDTLMPERWLDPENAANKNPKNYMVWGAGPHKCIGLEYAMMNIALVVAVAAMQFDWKHEITPDSYNIDIIATLFPRDGCRMQFTPREN